MGEETQKTIKMKKRKNIRLFFTSTILLSMATQCIFAQNTQPQMPCSVPADYYAVRLEAPEKWYVNETDSLNIIWCSDAPFQQLWYRTDNDQQWTKRTYPYSSDIHTFSLSASNLENTTEVQWMLLVGCDCKLNYEAVSEGVIKLER